jgi:hypothetical protein
MAGNNAGLISGNLNTEAKEKLYFINVNLALKASRLSNISVTKFSSFMCLHLTSLDCIRLCVFANPHIEALLRTPCAVSLYSQVTCFVLCKAACIFLGAFAKFRKATISFVMSVCPHGTTRFPMDGFS